MLTEYINAAMRKAVYEILPEDKSFYGEIPGFQGVYANADTLEECREELREVVREWLALGVRFGHDLPTVDGTALNSAAKQALLTESNR